MRVPLGITVAGLAIAGGGGRLQAQASDALYARFNAVSGWELRGFTFDSGVGTKSVWQWSVLLVVVAPLGRKVSLDLTTHYANGRLETYAGSTETLAGFTDTQLRLMYTASRDRLVGSVSFNLPTGQHTLSPSEFAVAGGGGAPYFLFPFFQSWISPPGARGLAGAPRAGPWGPR